MIPFFNNGVLIQPNDQLPELPEKITNLFLDTETTSRDPKKKSVNPWHDCWPCGIAVTWDDHWEAYYIPIEHHKDFCGAGNYDEKLLVDWLYDLFNRTDNWINHNLKYDAHVLWRAWGIDPQCELRCTLALSKIIDTDRGMRGGYGLDALSGEWLNNDIWPYEAAMQKYLGKDNKDYGRIPVDVLGEYACQDVFTNRDLWHYIDKACPESCREVWQDEIELTRVLIRKERRGLRVDPQELRAFQHIYLNELIRLDSEIAELVGRHINPNSSEQCYELLCKTYGLPVQAWTNPKKKSEDDEYDGNPSFGKDALEKYLVFPEAPREAIKKIVEYRKKSKLNSGFIEPYLQLHIDGIIHSSYNQAVRTGRMSCKAPNMQQLNKDAKALFKPRKGNSFLLFDYSQIEFRLIVHFINDLKAIQAYRENPRTDFHQWMADLISIPRSAAKRMNFLIGYGGGKEKTKIALMQVDEIVQLAQMRIEQLAISSDHAAAAYTAIVEEIALMAYSTYHNRLPGLKATSRKVAATCIARIPPDELDPARQYGYVMDMYGGRRHLPRHRAHIGFNTICQATAARLIKERTVLLDKLIPDESGIGIVAQVHDALLFEGPSELIRDPRTINDISWIMENPRILPKLRIPIKVNAGVSDISWADADRPENDCTIDVPEKPEPSPFFHLTPQVCAV